MVLSRCPRTHSGMAWVLLLAALLATALPAVSTAAPLPGDEIRLTVETPDYRLDDTGLRVPGYATHATPGAPALPVRVELVPLPHDGAWTISYTASAGELLALDAALPAVSVPELNLHRPGGLPVNDPDAAADLPGAVPLVERPDPAIYGTDAFYPARLVEAGPVVQQRGQRFLPVRVFPFQYNPVQGQLQLHRTIEVRITLTASAADVAGQAESYAAGSLTPAANPPGLRIRTAERGLYRLTYGDLQAAGVPLASANPAQFAVSYLGAPVDIEVTGAADGRFDPGDLVIFYAEPYVGRYMAQNVYRFTWSGVTPARMAARQVSAPPDWVPVSIIPQTIRFERDRSYYSTYDLPRDADHLFDDPLYANAAVPVAGTTYTLTLRYLAAARTAQLRASFHGGAALDQAPDQSVALRINNYDLGVHQWDGSVTHLVKLNVPVAVLAEGANPLRLEAALAQLPGLTGYWVSPDWVELTYPAWALAESNRLYVEGQWAGPAPSGPRVYLPLLFYRAAGAPAAQPIPFSAGGFTSAGVRVYDVRDARRPVRLDGAAQTPAGATYEVQFLDGAGAGAAYFLAGPDALRQPAAIEPDAGSAWRSPDVQADYIAVVHRSLWDAIQPLLDHRAAEGLRVAKVDVQHVYDEFSGGRVDPEALRAFLSYAYHNWNPGGDRPAYVLLVGDGHYDFKAALRPDMPNLIPPYLLHIDPFIGETAADNRYASVDGDADFMPDMALGRIPARTPAETTALVNKILAYEDPAAMPGGAWQNRVTFVADQADDPVGDFHAMSDNIRLNTLPGTVESRTIYWEKDYIYANPGQGTPDMNTAIKAALGDSLMVQWFGHASRFRWGSTQVFSNFSIAAMSQTASLPMTVDYSCWTGYFINLFDASGDSRSLSEAFVLTPDRGSVVTVGPSGLHVGSALLELNRGLVKSVFSDGIQPVGVALDAARQHFLANSDAWLDVVDTTVLFGDPATRLRLP